jgi:hypothetical protein
MEMNQEIAVKLAGNIPETYRKHSADIDSVL